MAVSLIRYFSQDAKKSFGRVSYSRPKNSYSPSSSKNSSLSSSTPKDSSSPSISKYSSNSTPKDSSSYNSSKKPKYSSNSTPKDLNNEDKRNYDKLSDEEKKDFGMSQIRNRKALKDAIEKSDHEAVWILHDKVTRLERIDYNKMIATMARVGKVQKAFKIYNTMKKAAIVPNGNTFESLLLACSRAEGEGQYIDRCFYVLEQMARYDLKPSIFCYNLILQTCVHQKDFEALNGIFNLIKSTGNEPDESTYTAMMQAHENSLDEVFNYWKIMKDELNPSIKSYNIFLNLLSKSSNPMKAVDFYYDEIKGKVDVDHRMFGILISSTLKNRNEEDYKVGEKIVEEMLKMKDTLTIDTYLNNLVLRLYAKLDRKKFEKYYESMKKTNLPLDTYTYQVLIDNYGRWGKINKSLELLKESIVKGLRLPTFVLEDLLKHIDYRNELDKTIEVVNIYIENNYKPASQFLQIAIENLNKLKQQQKYEKECDKLLEILQKNPTENQSQEKKIIPKNTKRKVEYKINRIEEIKSNDDLKYKKNVFNSEEETLPTIPNSTHTKPLGGPTEKEKNNYREKSKSFSNSINNTNSQSVYQKTKELTNDPEKGYSKIINKKENTSPEYGDNKYKKPNKKNLSSKSQKTEESEKIHIDSTGWMYLENNDKLLEKYKKKKTEEEL